MTEEAARRLVFAVLEKEYRARKPLWQGTLGFAVAAALGAGLLLDEASVTVLLARRHELMLRSAELPDKEIPAFRRGVASGLLRACAPAVLAIIVCSAVLFVL